MPVSCPFEGAAYGHGRAAPSAFVGLPRAAVRSAFLQFVAARRSSSQPGCNARGARLDFILSQRRWACQEETMNRFDQSPLAAFPRLTRTVRAVLGTGVVALYAFVLVTAGPGNGWQPPREVQYVKLPTVVVVGQREAAPQAVVASAAALNKVNMVR
jgi:hypothetical protein